MENKKPTYLQLENRIKELELQNSYLNMITSSFQEMIFIITKDLVVEYVNNFAAQALNSTFSEIIGLKIIDIFPPKIAKEQNEYLLSVFKSGEQLQKIAKSKLGSDFVWLETLLIPVKNEQGIVEKVLGISRDVTEKVKADEALQISEEKFRSIIGNIPAAVYRCLNDENWTMIYISDMIEKISGYPASHFINNSVRSFSSIILKEDNEAITEIINNAIEKKISINIEYRIITKNGKVKWMLEQASGVYSVDGDLLYLDGSIYDNTEKKVIEESLKESEEKYRMLVENQAEGISILDVNEKFLFTNPAADVIFGVNKGTLINRNIKEFTSTSEFERIKQETQKRLKGQKSTYETEIICPNGSKKSLLISSSPYMDKNGLYLGAFGIFRDITKLKKNEKALLESENRYKTLTEITDEGILIHENGEIIDVNPSLLKLYNTSTDELKQKNIFDFVHPDYLDFVKRKYKERFVGSYKIDIIDGTGNVIPVEINVKNHLVNNKNRRVLSIRDITERKAQEDILKKSEQELRIANITKDKFFSIIAHDLRSPIGNFLQYCSYLNEKYDEFSEESLKQFIDQMHKLSHNTFDLLNNLLTWSRIQLNKIDLTPKRFSLIELVNKSTNILDDQIKRKEIRFTKNINQSIYIYANEESIKMILRNLLSNAIKFTPRSGNINISAKMIVYQAGSNNLVEVCVMDSGIGISADNLNNLFKIDTAISTKGTEDEIGTGLGLVLCKEFVEKNGGKIWVESNESKGSKFYFTIPCR